MTTLFKKGTQFFQKISDVCKKTTHHYSMLTKKQKVTFWIIASLVIFGFVYSSIHKSTAVIAAPDKERKVTVASLASLSNNEQNLPLVGTVTSVSEATIRSETGGKLIYVNKKLGDTVYAGGIIAEFENSGERASLLQAEGVYEQAKVAKDIAALNGNQTGSSLLDTKSQALNVISSSYTTMDDAIRGKTDSAYSDPRFEQIKLLISLPDSSLSNALISKRKSLESILLKRELRNETLTQASDLVLELTTVQSEVQVVKAYLDDLFSAYSKSLPDGAFTQSVLDTNKANIQLARLSIASTLSSVVSARATLSASLTANQVAGSGGTASSGSLLSADAQVKQALGAYNAAQSRLEKTIIRSPISGTLNSLSINTGDYISAFTQVAVVSNNGALEIISFVTEDDAKRITVGSPVTINGSISGVVTRIASAIDSTTKKIELRVGIKDMKSELINGQSVTLTIERNKNNIVHNPNTPIVVPLSALKLTPRGTYIFTVSASNTLISIPVKEGAILGEQIQILQGLTGSESIVTDARGLKEGMAVTVAK